MFGFDIWKLITNFFGFSSDEKTEKNKSDNKKQTEFP